MAGGTVFWQATGDAYEIDAFAVVGTHYLRIEPNVVFHWINFWGSNHRREVTAPTGANLPTVRLLDRPRPGRVEPADLILDPGYHHGRLRMDVGADLFSLGVSPKTFSNGLGTNPVN